MARKSTSKPVATTPAAAITPDPADLSSRAMLVSLKVSAWQARKTDRRVNREVADAHQTEERAGNYRKRLLPSDSPSFKAIGNLEVAARNDHYKHTLPWLDGGTRILPASNFFAYSECMRGHRATFERAVAQFLGEYPSLREEAKAYLNGLYNDGDYPAPSRMASLFAFEMRVMPMPAAQDFRASLPSEDIEAIRHRIEDDAKEAAGIAMRDAWTRLRNAIGHLHGQVSKETGPVYWKSLLTNLGELCDVLPRLNLLGDANLDKMTAEIRASILSTTPDDARNVIGERERIASEAERIGTAMQALMA